MPVVSKRWLAGRVQRDRAWVGWFFLAPFIVLFFLVFIVPIFYALYLSFFRDQIVGGIVFVGVANYVAVFGDAKFWVSVGNVALFFVMQVPMMLLLALLAALALDSGRLRGVPVYRISLFLPYAVPGVLAALIWGFLYGKNFGLVGSLGELLGVELPDPLSGSLILPSIANIVTWGAMGFFMLVYYGALKAVPSELYEAAKIDGAGPLRTIVSIKLPALRPALMVTIIFGIIGVAQLFGEPQILASNSPGVITTYFTPNIYAYNLSFLGKEQNYAAVVAIVMGIFTLVVALSTQLLGERKDSRGD